MSAARLVATVGLLLCTQACLAHGVDLSSREAVALLGAKRLPAATRKPTKQQGRAATHSQQHRPTPPGITVPAGGSTYVPTREYQPAAHASRGESEASRKGAHQKKRRQQGNTKRSLSRKAAFLERQFKQGIRRASELFVKRQKHKKQDAAAEHKESLDQSNELKRMEDIHANGKLAIAKEERSSKARVIALQHKLYNRDKKEARWRKAKRQKRYVKSNMARRKETRQRLVKMQKRKDARVERRSKRKKATKQRLTTKLMGHLHLDD